MNPISTTKNSLKRSELHKWLIFWEKQQAGAAELLSGRTCKQKKKKDVGSSGHSSDENCGFLGAEQTTWNEFLQLQYTFKHALRLEISLFVASYEEKEAT